MRYAGPVEQLLVEATADALGIDIEAAYERVRAELDEIADEMERLVFDDLQTGRLAS